MAWTPPASDKIWTPPETDKIESEWKAPDTDKIWTPPETDKIESEAKKNPNEGKVAPYKLSGGSQTVYRPKDGAVWIGQEHIDSEKWMKDKGVKPGWYQDSGKRYADGSGAIDASIQMPDVEGGQEYAPAETPGNYLRGVKYRAEESVREIASAGAGIVKGVGTTLGGFGKLLSEALPQPTKEGAAYAGSAAEVFKEYKDRVKAGWDKHVASATDEDKIAEFVGEQLPYMALPGSVASLGAKAGTNIAARVGIKEGAKATAAKLIGAAAGGAAENSVMAFASPSDKTGDEYWQGQKAKATDGVTIGLGALTGAGSAAAAPIVNKVRNSGLIKDAGKIEDSAKRTRDAGLGEPTIGQAARMQGVGELVDKGVSGISKTKTGETLRHTDELAAVVPLSGMKTHYEGQASKLKSRLGEMRDEIVAASGKFKDSDPTIATIHEDFKAVRDLEKQKAHIEFEKVQKSAHGKSIEMADKSETIKAIREGVKTLSDRDTSAAKALQKFLSEIESGAIGKTWDGLAGIQDDLQAAAIKVRKGLGTITPMDRAKAHISEEISHAIRQDQIKFLDEVSNSKYRNKAIGDNLRQISEDIKNGRKPSSEGFKSVEGNANFELSEGYKKANKTYHENEKLRSTKHDKYGDINKALSDPSDIDKMFTKIIAGNDAGRAEHLWKVLGDTGRTAAAAVLLEKIQNAPNPATFIKNHRKVLNQFLPDHMKTLETIHDFANASPEVVNFGSNITTGKAVPQLAGAAAIPQAVMSALAGHVGAAVTLGGSMAMARLYKVFSTSPKAKALLSQLGNAKTDSDKKVIADRFVNLMLSSSNSLRNGVGDQLKETQKDGKPNE